MQSLLSYIRLCWEFVERSKDDHCKPQFVGLNLLPLLHSMLLLLSQMFRMPRQGTTVNDGSGCEEISTATDQAPSHEHISGSSQGWMWHLRMQHSDVTGLFLPPALCWEKHWCKMGWLWSTALCLGLDDALYVTHHCKGIVSFEMR